MSRSKKPKYKDINASIGEHDYFGTIFDGMCRSVAYQKLSLGARHFYTLCRVVARSERGRKCLYNHGNEYNIQYNDNCFVFPAKFNEEYGIKRQNAYRYFIELEQHGFIKKLECNKYQKKINVYMFVDVWKKAG